jgi:pyruvate kinase
MRQISLSYLVYADFTLKDITSNEPLSRSICRLIGDRYFHDEDLIIVLAGSFGAKHGASYIEISTARNLKEKCIYSTGQGK